MVGKGTSKQGKALSREDRAKRGAKGGIVRHITDKAFPGLTTISKGTFMTVVVV